MWKELVAFDGFSLLGSINAEIKTREEMEMRGIDPRTSRMLSERSTIWATSPSYSGNTRRVASASCSRVSTTTAFDLLAFHNTFLFLFIFSNPTQSFRRTLRGQCKRLHFSTLRHHIRPPFWTLQLTCQQSISIRTKFR